MKFITQVKDDIEFLSRVYDASEKVMNFLDITKIMQIRQERPESMPVMPIFPKDFKDLPEEEKENIIKARTKATEEINKIMQVQQIKNVKKIVFNICKEHPAEFVDTMRSLIILEDGEDYPHGMQLLSTAVSMFTSAEMMDFFTQLTRLGQTFTGK